YKQKRKTKAMLAREAGLEPFAQWIWNLGQGLEESSTALEVEAQNYFNSEHEINDIKTVLEKTTDLLIEILTLNPDHRKHVQTVTFKSGFLKTEKGKKAQTNSKFERYFEYSESIQSLQNPQNSHRYLAIR